MKNLIFTFFALSFFNTIISARINANPSLDIALTDIKQPLATATAAVITPTVVLKNTGSEIISSATITYKVYAGDAKKFNWTGSLTPGLSVNVTLPAFPNENGSHTFIAMVSNPNGGVDGDLTNNILTRAFTSVIFNVLPTVSMTAPVYRSTIKSSDTYTLSANAIDKDGTVKKVEFYLGSKLLGTDSVAPFALTCNKWQVGTFAVTAKAYDDRNGLTTSAATTLIVIPVINASIIKDNIDIAQQSDVFVGNQSNGQNSADSYVQPKKVNHLSIRPNPASDYTNLTINISKGGVFNLMLTNISGKMVQAKTVQLSEGENSIELEVDALPDGLYIVSFYNNEIKITEKLVVSK